MIPYPTRTGFTLILLSFMLYLASMSSGSGLLFLILGVLFALYIINVFASRKGFSSLTFHPPASLDCVEGEQVTGTWEVQNHTKHASGFVELAGSFGPLLRVGTVPPLTSIHITPEVSFPKRGVYPYKSLVADCTYPFGLISCRKSLAMTGEIVVYPFVYPCEAPPAAGFEPMVGGNYVGQNRTSSGDSFHGVRPYQMSDPVKLIHWRSSAKGHGLMSKEFDEELSGRVGLVMDCVPRPGPKTDELLDWSARAAGSLTLAALDAGHQVEFIRVGDQTSVPVPPFADGSEVMDALARLEPNPDRGLDELASAALLIPSKASICLVTTRVDDAVRGFVDSLLAAKRRKVAVYVPESCWDEATELPVPIRLFQAKSMAEEWQHV